MMYDKPVSYSGLKLFKQCPRRWADQYIDGNRYPSGPAAQRGTEIHARLEAYFNEKPYPDGEGILYERWRNYMVSLVVRSPKPEVELAVDADWQPVAWDAPEAFFRGKLDLVLPGEIYEIYDWKTGKQYDEHSEQAEAYVALAPPADRYQTSFVYLDQYPTTMTKLHSTEERDSYRETITADIIRLREATVYPGRPGGGCRYCPLNWRAGGGCHDAP